jgi:hypothetical protein
VTHPGNPHAGAGHVTRERSLWPYIGVGCFTLPIGFFGGGMIAVLFAKIIGSIQGCVPPEGFPACNTFEFLLPGALIGMLGLPTAAILRLRHGRKATTAVNETK